MFKTNARKNCSQVSQLLVKVLQWLLHLLDVQRGRGSYTEPDRVKLLKENENHMTKEKEKLERKKKREKSEKK